MERSTLFYESGKRYGSLQLIGALFTLIGAVQMAIGALLLAFGLYTLLSGTASGAPPETAASSARQVDARSGSSTRRRLSRRRSGWDTLPLSSLVPLCVDRGSVFRAAIRRLRGLDSTAHQFGLHEHVRPRGPWTRS